MVINSEKHTKLEALLRTDENELSLAIKETGEANKKSQGAGYVVSGYFRLINAEPDADLGQRFSHYEKEVNMVLGQARETATYYLYGSSNVMSLQRQILGLNTTIISECESQLAYLQVLRQFGALMNTNDAVEMIDQLISNGERAKNAAYAVERELSRVEQDVRNQSNAMKALSEKIGNESQLLSNELKDLRYRLNSYDTQIEILELRIAETTEEVQQSSKVVATALVLRRVIRSVIRGVAFIRTIREHGEELDELAVLHERRSEVFEQLASKEEAMALVSGYDQNLEAIAYRSKHAAHELTNMGNAWASQGDTFRQIKNRTISENASVWILLAELDAAERDINNALQVAKIIREQMTSIPFVQEQQMTVYELYRRGRTTMRSDEWEYPDENVAVIVQSLIKKYVNRERRAV